MEVRRFVLFVLVFGLFASPVLLLAESALWRDEGYLLRLSKARNAYDLGRTERCVLEARRLTKDYPNAPEPHHLLGRVHLEKGFFRVAVVHLERATKLQDNFLVPEERCDLGLNLSAALHFLGNEQKQRQTLRALKAWASSSFKRHPVKRYAWAVAEASFALGLMAYRKGDFLEAQDEFMATLGAKGPYRKFPYMLLALYYGRTPQERIDRAKGLRSSPTNSPRKEVVFRFYHERYKELVFTPSERKLLEDPWARRLVLELKSLERVLGSGNPRKTKN